MVCNSDKGEFLEVTPAKEIVWKYINPVISSGALAQGVVTTDSEGNWIPNNQVFRSYRYGQDYPGLVNKDLTPGDPIELYNVAIYDETGVIKEFSLQDNYPNPFNPTTNIEFSLTERTFVTITIYDLGGNTIKILAKE